MDDLSQETRGGWRALSHCITVSLLMTPCTLLEWPCQTCKRLLLTESLLWLWIGSVVRAVVDFPSFLGISQALFDCSKAITAVLVTVTVPLDDIASYWIWSKKKKRRCLLQRPMRVKIPTSAGICGFVCQDRSSAEFCLHGKGWPEHWPSQCSLPLGITIWHSILLFCTEGFFGPYCASVTNFTWLVHSSFRTL